MGQVHPLPRQPVGRSTPVFAVPVAEVRAIGGVYCALCRTRFGARSLRYHLVSPQQGKTITVCHMCHKAALGEGYRPAE